MRTRPAPGIAGLVRGVRRVAALAALAGAGLWLGGYPGALLLPAVTGSAVLLQRRPAAGRRWRRAAGERLAPVPVLVLVLVGSVLVAAVSGALSILLQDHGATSTLVAGLWLGRPAAGLPGRCRRARGRTYAAWRRRIRESR